MEKRLWSSKNVVNYLVFGGVILFIMSLFATLSTEYWGVYLSFFIGFPSLIIFALVALRSIKVQDKVNQLLTSSGHTVEVEVQDFETELINDDSEKILKSVTIFSSRLFPKKVEELAPTILYYQARDRYLDLYLIFERSEFPDVFKNTKSVRAYRRRL